jgi:CelD/BcsL family acetyltransferase involved in cellulose biosynthesis
MSSVDARALQSEALELRCVTDTGEFRSLQRDWQVLYRQCPDATPFNSWEWLFSWWQTYRGARKLKLLTWRSGDALVGVAPLCLAAESSGLGVGCRVLRFIGDGSSDSDHLGILAPPAAFPPVCSQLARWLRDDKDWDVLVLREMPEGSKLSEALGAAVATFGCRVRLELGRAAVLGLPGSLEEFLTERQPRFRTKLRALLRKVDQGGLTVEIGCEQSRQLRHRLRSLFSLHQERWEQTGGPGVFGDVQKRSFYRRFVPRFARCGWLRLYSLRQGDGYLAHQLCFGHDGTTYLLQEGFDRSDPSASYGQMLRAAVIRHLIESGERSYDFLGGFTNHKAAWGAREAGVLHLVAARPNWRGRLYFALPVLRERLGGFVKRTLPPAVVDRIRRLLGRG